MPVMRLPLGLLSLVLAGTVLAGATAAHAGPKAAIFAFELIDVSGDGEPQAAPPKADEAQRLRLATDELRRLAATEAGYEVLDLSGLASEIEKAAPFHKCEGCEVDIARRAGAEVAITGAVRKISSLILVIQIYVRDVATGTVNEARRVELRGNSDESWLRGVRRLITLTRAAD
jgi:uncharacterized protein DUF2380